MYGLKWYEIEEMPIDKYLQYERATEKIVGLEMLRAMEATVFPNLKVEGQKKIRKKYERMAGYYDKEGKRFEDAFKEIKSWQMKK